LKATEVAGGGPGEELGVPVVQQQKQGGSGREERILMAAVAGGKSGVPVVPQQEQGGSGREEQGLGAADEAANTGLPVVQQQKQELAGDLRVLSAVGGSGSSRGTLVMWNATALQQQPDGSSMVFVVGAAKPCLGFRVWVQLLGHQEEEGDVHKRRLQGYGSGQHQRRVVELEAVANSNDSSSRSRSHTYSSTMGNELYSGNGSRPPHSNSSSSSKAESNSNKVESSSSSKVGSSSSSSNSKVGISQGGVRGRWLDVSHLAAPLPPLWDDHLMEVRVNR
jgi:hypothetical protein